MRCLSCGKLSFKAICQRCKITLFSPSIRDRMVGNLQVYSFYKYQDIEDFIKTKYYPMGYRVYKELAKITTREFIKEFTKHLTEKIYIVGVDEHIKYGYSNVSILMQNMKTELSLPLYGKLIANNRVNYAGKNLEFRLSHPRDFKYYGKDDITVILVDDTITTGTTLQEAHNVLISHNVTVLFALTLSDV